MKINVRGVDHTVVVDDAGVFKTIVDGELYTSDTFAGLREKVLTRMHKTAGAKVEIPFTIVEAGQIRNGIATAVREIDGSILVRWDDTGRPGLLTWHHRPLNRLGVGDADTYRRMIAARDAAQSTVDRFERPRSINLKDKISEALAADSEGTGTG